MMMMMMMHNLLKVYDFGGDGNLIWQNLDFADVDDAQFIEG